MPHPTATFKHTHSYHRLESLRAQVDEALVEITGEPTKQQVINVMLRIEKYLAESDRIARYLVAHNALSAPVVTAIVRERADVNELITMIHRRPELVGNWTREKLEGLVNGIASQINEVMK